MNEAVARISTAMMVDADVNSMTDRAAMGLPDHYVRPRAESAQDVGADLAVDPAALADRLADPGTALERRIAAGTLLALVGDPRIDPLDPVMLPVPAGTLPMGTHKSDVDALYAESARIGVRREWIVKECPRHEVEVKAFAIARVPVTNFEYAMFLADTRHAEMPSSWTYGRYHPATANHPVYTVSPESADKYASWLRRRTGRPFRLPTEREWEYAAAGPTGTRYPWGEQWCGDLANTLETGLLTTTPVGVFPGGRSWCGALDLAGNVEEFVADRYQPYPGGKLVEDDLFKRVGYYRVARGGAFNRFRDLARNQRRHGPYPRSLYAMGFRLAEGT